jgi:hypothetical protein
MKTVAIVGSQLKTRGLAPWDDLDTDIWVFNEAASSPWCKRADAVFQMHTPEIYRSAHNRADPDHWSWLKKDHGPLAVYMQDHDAEVPNSYRYPLDEVAGALLPGFRQGVELVQRRYFTSTVAYALALAIFQGYERIMLYGIEMLSDTEYTYQRPCVLFWVGVALGSGIAVDFFSGDEIFDAPLYGYDGVVTMDPEEFTVRATELRATVAECMDKKAALEKEMRAGVANGNLGELLKKLTDATIELGAAEGALHECDRYAYKVTGMIAEGAPPFIDRTEFEAQAALNVPMKAKSYAAMLEMRGAINYVMQAWINGHNPAALEQVRNFSEQMLRSAYGVGRAAGIYDENEKFISRLDARIRAAGGQRAAEMITEG